MPKNTDSSLLIADSKKGLSQFILDLCGFSLDNAGYNSKGYAFHLHIAFRRQTILHAKKWKEMCMAVAENPLNWHDGANSMLLADAEKFAQLIVDEVQQAEVDPWGVKLIKTGYLSTLDKARKNSEQAIMLLAAPANHAENLTASEVVSEDPETSKYLDALHLHITYLDSLLSLPFVLESFCLRVAANRKVNYEPLKNAQMLASLLDTINLAVDEKAKIYAIKLALKITMPSLPMDGALLETIKQDLLPFIAQVIVNNRKLQEVKDVIFPVDNTVSTARKTLLATVGVEFDSLQAVVQNTLLEPVQQCAELAAGVQGFTYAANQVIQSNNVISRVAQIGVMFGHFDKLANIPNKISPGLLPDWLRETNSYYQLLRTKMFEFHGVAEGAYNGLGIFYNQVVSYIPESIRRYFTTPDSLARVWAKIDEENEHCDVKTAMAYLAFYELTMFGGIDEPIKARFYHAYMMDVLKLSPLGNNAVIYDYGVYKKLEPIFVRNVDLSLSLSERMTNFVANNEVLPDEVLPLFPKNGQKFDVLVMVHHLKNKEAQFNDNLTNGVSVQPILKELTAALIEQDKNSTINEFRKEFLGPATQRMLLAYMQQRFIPLLEQVIDNPDTTLANMAHVNQLPRIYSKLRSDVNLSLNDYDELKRCFKRCNQFHIHKNEFDLLRPLVEQLSEIMKTVDGEIVHYQTPHQLMLTEIKTKLSYVEMAFTAVLEGLDKQIRTSKALRKLSARDSNLYNLCQNKIKYIQTLKTRINALIQDIHLHPDDLAIKINGLLNGDNLKAAKDALQKTSKLKMATQMIRFAWHVLPADEKKPDDNFLNNLLVYYIKDTDFGSIYEAQETFRKGLDSNPVPELMPLLNDPLAIANIMPRQEEIMDSVIEHLLGLKGQSLFSWGTNFVTTTAKNLLSGINKETLVSLFPYSFVGAIAWQMIQSKEMQAMLSPLLYTLVEEYGVVAADKALELAEAAKNRIYPLLGIAIQKSVERSAYNYAALDDNRILDEANSDAERDAFAMYYLQYQAIKQRNPAVQTADCVKFLFKVLLDAEGVETRNDMISQLVAKFNALDETLKYEALRVEDSDKQLLFLINSLDLNDPKNNNIIRLTLINRLLLMSLEVTKALSDDKAIELEERAIKALSRILIKNSEAKPLPDKEDIDDLSFVAINSTSSMMNALKPAKERIAGLQLGRLQTALNNIKEKIDIAVGSRLEMLSANDNRKNKPFLGRSAVVVDYENARKNKPRIIVAIVSFFIEALTFISFWMAIIFPAILGSGLLQSLFVAIGVAGIAGTAASIVGAVVFGVFALARLTFKLGMEIWTRRRELTAIVANPDYSVARKIGLTLLFGLKCIGLALLKTVFTDYLLHKITYLLAIGPIKRLRNLFRVHPSRDTVVDEHKALANVADKLEDLNAQIDVQIASPELALSNCIDTTYLELKTAMDAATKSLATLSSNDVRNTNEYRKTLASYETAFANITQLYNNLQVIKKLESGMDTKEKLPDVNDLPANASSPEIVRPHIAIDVDAYYQKTHLFDEELPLPSKTATLISGFFQALAYAGRIFSWGNGSVVIQDNNVEDMGSSSSLDGSFMMLNASLSYNQKTEVDNLLSSICMIEDSTCISTKAPKEDVPLADSEFLEEGSFVICQR
ncbi:MAG: hypothetical protein Q8M03_13400 [Legionella sp.]|nr:hypothetical protein [Legionella sp.]